MLRADLLGSGAGGGVLLLLQDTWIIVALYFCLSTEIFIWGLCGLNISCTSTTAESRAKNWYQ